MSQGYKEINDFLAINQELTYTQGQYMSIYGISNYLK